MEKILKAMKPAVLLKEKYWEKKVSEKMKELIDQNIVVLSQNFDEKHNKSKT